MAEFELTIANSSRVPRNGSSYCSCLPTCARGACFGVLARPHCRFPGASRALWFGVNPGSSASGLGRF